MSFDSFAAITNCSRQTLYNWAEQFPEFSEAKEIADEKCLFFWEKIGVAGVLGKHKWFNPTAWIFNMKNRFGWRDLGQVTNTGVVTVQLAYQKPGELNGADQIKIAQAAANHLQERTGVQTRLVQIGDSSGQEE